MRFHAEGDDISYEVIPMNNGKKIIIYFKYKNNTYYLSNKGRGTHFLEQIFDENNDLISETIKENPYLFVITEDEIEKTRNYVEEYDKKLKKSLQKSRKRSYLQILKNFFI